MWMYMVGSIGLQCAGEKHMLACVLHSQLQKTQIRYSAQCLVLDRYSK